MKSKAPNFVERTAVSIVPWPEIMITMGGLSRAWIFSSAWMPSMPGSQMSSKNQIAIVMRKEVQASFAALHRVHKVPFVLQDTGERLANPGFVIDNKNGVVRHDRL